MRFFSSRAVVCRLLNFLRKVTSISSNSRARMLSRLKRILYRWKHLRFIRLFLSQVVARLSRLLKDVTSISSKSFTSIVNGIELFPSKPTKANTLAWNISVSCEYFRLELSSADCLFPYVTSQLFPLSLSLVITVASSCFRRSPHKRIFSPAKSLFHANRATTIKYFRLEPLSFIRLFSSFVVICRLSISHHNIMSFFTVARK